MGDPHQQHLSEVPGLKRENISQIVFFGLAIIACFYMPEFISGLFSEVAGTDHVTVVSIFNLK